MIRYRGLPDGRYGSVQSLGIGTSLNFSTDAENSCHPSTLLLGDQLLDLNQDATNGSL